MQSNVLANVLNYKIMPLSKNALLSISHMRPASLMFIYSSFVDGLHVIFECSAIISGLLGTFWPLWNTTSNNMYSYAYAPSISICLY